MSIGKPRTHSSLKRSDPNSKIQFDICYENNEHLIKKALYEYLDDQGIASEKEKDKIISNRIKCKVFEELSNPISMFYCDFYDKEKLIFQIIMDVAGIHLYNKKY